ncbi:MAG: AAA family ATPase [Pseudonocardia sp.]|nr:AAA family ATPase [Pseudonocardia sp.]
MGDVGDARAFRGRDDELSRLVAALLAARDGHMGAILVGGEAGVGKTRLISEFTSRARDEGATVLVGNAIDIADAPPFWPVVAAVRDAARRGADEGTTELFGRALAELGPPSSANARPRQPIQLLELLHRLIVDLAALSCVVLVIEDLQWVDQSTRDLIVYLVANLSSEPVLLVVSYRTDPRARPTSVTSMLSELRRHRKVSTMEVSPLSRAALAELVDYWAPDRPGLEPLVWQRSAGNTFIAEETVRAILSGDALGLPTTLRELVLSRVALLSPLARQVVRAVAVSAGPLPHRLLAEVLEQDAGELLEAVREAADLGMVVPDSQGDGYQLRHGLMVEVVAGDLLPGEHIDLHRRFATALANSPDSNAADLAARVAHHWYEAGEAEPALVATVAAAHASERIRGYAEARRHWLRAAELTMRVPEQPDVPGRADCLDMAARAAELSGDHEQAVALLDQLLGELEPSSGLAAALLTARKGDSLSAAGRGKEASNAYQASAALLPRTGVEHERAQVLAGYAIALLQSAQYAAARRVADEALALARSARVRSAEAKVLAILGFSLAYLEDTEAGSAALAEALAVAEQTNEPAAIGEALLRRAELLAGPLNRLVEGVACAREGAKRMHGLGLSHTSGVSLLACAANGLFRLGRWEEAQRAVNEAWACFPTGAGALEVRLARCRLDIGRGKLDAAADDLEAVELLTSSTGEARYRIPLVILRAGLEMWRHQPQVALEHVEDCLVRTNPCVDDVWSVAPLIWHGTKAWAEMTRLGLSSPSAKRVSLLRDHCARLAHRGSGAVAAVREVVETYSTTCQAEIARAEDRHDALAWQRIAERWERHQQPYPAAYARLRRAEALLSVSSRSSVAADDLRSAGRTARELGAQPLLDEIMDLAQRARVPLLDVAKPDPLPTPRPEPPGVLDSLTARELEVLTELAAGRTNREIASRLFISEKTVGVHVTRIFAKINVHTRVQASAVLHRSHLTTELPKRIRSNGAGSNSVDKEA